MHVGIGRGKPLTRIFQASDLQHKLVGMKKRGKGYPSWDHGFTRMDHWRLAEGKEKEWSVVDEKGEE